MAPVWYYRPNRLHLHAGVHSASRHDSTLVSRQRSDVGRVRYIGPHAESTMSARQGSRIRRQLPSNWRDTAKSDVAHPSIDHRQLSALVQADHPLRSMTLSRRPGRPYTRSPATHTRCYQCNATLAKKKREERRRRREADYWWRCRSKTCRLFIVARTKSIENARLGDVMARSSTVDISFAAVGRCVDELCAMQRWAKAHASVLCLYAEQPAG